MIILILKGSTEFEKYSDHVASTVLASMFAYLHYPEPFNQQREGHGGEKRKPSCHNCWVVVTQPGPEVFISYQSTLKRILYKWGGDSYVILAWKYHIVQPSK